ncbi:transcription repressor NadR [Neobacillus mesonae]|uniref:transcription repressor NadR n=1 Tax=Neobacillus mesonae TaxID=1193713 RepID=UPI00204084D0|nr:transcription repressor NadR [Neobacillus mesonae]MCM3567076.1 transcription repressor NadR [Neobacillus mesonae]
MITQKKLTGEERRLQLLQMLKETDHPITGSELADKANVSRQAIVGDIALLKAKNEPIMATSKGYIYLNQTDTAPIFKKTIACRHLPEDVERELNLMVDHGVTIRDVQVEHPVFGHLAASIMVSTRKEVKQFIERIARSKASYLSELTCGRHLHTLTSASEAALKEVEDRLRKAGFLDET